MGSLTSILNLFINPHNKFETPKTHYSRFVLVQLNDIYYNFLIIFQQLEQLKCENQRLKDENGALIRVISKLSK